MFSLQIVEGGGLSRFEPAGLGRSAVFNRSVLLVLVVRRFVNRRLKPPVKTGLTGYGSNPSLVVHITLSILVNSWNDLNY